MNNDGKLAIGTGGMNDDDRDSYGNSKDNAKNKRANIDRSESIAPLPVTSVAVEAYGLEPE